MALITCKECKKEISDNARSCPHCGDKKESGCLAPIFLTVFMLAIAIAAIIIKLSTN